MTLAICIVLSLLMLVLPDEVQIDVANNLSVILTEPYWRVRNFGEDVVRVRRENAAMQAQLTQLELQMASEARGVRDAARLLGDGGLTAGYAGRLLPCQVVAREMGHSATMVKIRSLQAVDWQLYQPILAPEGLLGRVRRICSPTEAWVELLTAPGMALGCEIERTSLPGVLQTRGEDLFFDLISRDERDVQVDDLIITSGIDAVVDAETEGWAVMPRGLPVGVVSKVKPSVTNHSLEIQVEPKASFSHNTTVFVVLRENPPVIPELESSAAGEDGGQP
ncbi:MAG: rod shape-determining protein MreC [bacterium]